MPNPDYTDNELNHLSRNEQFLRKVKETVESNLANEKFGVIDLAEAMAVSRIQLYRKLHQLTGKNISQYIREIRLERAREMLKEDVASVSEIAYRVGFSSPTYFNKCFRDHYGYPPGEVIKNHLHEQNDFSIQDIKIEIERNSGKKRNLLATGINLFGRNKILTLIILTGIILTALIISFLIKKVKMNSIPPEENIISLAMFPFKNNSDEKNDYVANGIFLELQGYLQNIQNLKVYAGMDVDRLINLNKSKQEIGKELGIKYILEGNVWKEGNRFKLWIVLTEISSGEILWNKDFEQEYESLMDVVSSVTMSIVRSVKIVLSEEEKEEIEKPPTRSAEAYDIYLKAKESWEKAWDYSVSGYDNPDRELFFDTTYYHAKKALEYDSNYYAPLALIAEIEQYRGNMDTVKRIADEIFNKYPGRSDFAYLLLGDIYYKKKQYDSALLEYKNSHRINPNEPRAVFQIGNIYFSKKGNYIDGIKYLKEAAESPKLQYPPLVLALLSRAMMEIGEFQRSREYIYRAMNLTSACNYLFQVCGIYLYQGNPEKAIQVLDSICEISECRFCSKAYFHAYTIMKDTTKVIEVFTSEGFKPFSFDSAVFHAFLGEIPEAIRISNEIISTMLQNKEYYDIDDTSIGLWYASHYALLNDTENALKWLNTCDENELIHFSNVLMFSWEYTRLQENPDFISLINRLKTRRAEIRAQIREMEEKGEFDL